MRPLSSSDCSVQPRRCDAHSTGCRNSASGGSAGNAPFTKRRAAARTHRTPGISRRPKLHRWSVEHGAEAAQPTEHFPIGSPQLHHRCRSPRSPTTTDRSEAYASLSVMTRLRWAIKKADPVAFARLASEDPTVGRALPLASFRPLPKVEIQLHSYRLPDAPATAVTDFVLWHQISLVQRPPFASARSSASA
jgi:hypothetical protein